VFYRGYHLFHLSLNNELDKVHRDEPATFQINGVVCVGTSSAVNIARFSQGNFQLRLYQ